MDNICLAEVLGLHPMLSSFDLFKLSFFSLCDYEEHFKFWLCTELSDSLDAIFIVSRNRKFVCHRISNAVNFKISVVDAGSCT